MCPDLIPRRRAHEVGLLVLQKIVSTKARGPCKCSVGRPIVFHKVSGRQTPIDDKPRSLYPSFRRILQADDEPLRETLEPEIAQAFADALADALLQFTNQKSWEALRRLLALPKCTLLRRFTAREALGRISHFRCGIQIEDLWFWKRRPRKELNGVKNKPGHGDGWPEASASLPDASSAPKQKWPPKPNLREEMEALHPRGPRGVLHQPSPEEITTAFETARRLVTEAMMMEAVVDFKNTAPGPSGLSPTHLKDALEAPESKHLRRELLRFVHLLMSGHVHPRAMKYFGRAVLMPKPHKHGRLRPIAIGETLRRLVARCALKCAPARRAIAGLPPLQCGLGVPRATSTVAIGLQQLVHAGGPIGNWAILKIDVRNAFNCIRRPKIREVVQREVPELSSFVHMTHTEFSELYLTGNVVLQSEVGLQQGDPISILLFALALHDVVTKAHQALEAHAASDTVVWSQWYLDDGIFFGPLPALEAAMTAVVAGAGDLGIDLSYPKCFLWGPATRHLSRTRDASSSLDNLTVVPFTPGSGIVVLGLPVAYPSASSPFVDHHCEAKAQKAVESLRGFVVGKDTAETHAKMFTAVSPLFHSFQGVNCSSERFLDALHQINAVWRSAGLPHDIERIRPRIRLDALVVFLRRARRMGLPPQGCVPPPDLLTVVPPSADLRVVSDLLNTLRLCPPAADLHRTLESLLTHLTDPSFSHDDPAM